MELTVIAIGYGMNSSGRAVKIFHQGVGVGNEGSHRHVKLGFPA